MNNFHYKNLNPIRNPNNPDNQKLIRQLQQIQRDLQEDRRKLKTIDQKRRVLQEQFYQDNGKYSGNNMNYNKPPIAKSQVQDIANQVMNQIYGPIKKQTSPYRERPVINYENNQKKSQNQNYYHQFQDPMRNMNINNFSNNIGNYNSYEKYENLRKSPQIENQRQIKPLVDQFRNNQYQPKQNNIMQHVQRMQKQKRVNSANKRQMQKIKLQQKYANQYQYPFGSINRDQQKDKANRNNANINIPQNDYNNRNNRNYSRERSLEKNKNFQQKNPFIKDDQFIKQKRQEQQRQYRKKLQQQVQIQKKRKQQIKKQIKEQQYQFNGYVPVGTIQNTIANQNYNNNMIKNNSSNNGLPNNSSSTQRAINKPKTKKIDPNGDFPVYQYKNQKIIGQSQKHYMKLKVDQIKQKRRKGRIDEQQYQMSLRKIQDYYNCKVDRQYLQQKDQCSNNLNKNVINNEVYQNQYNNEANNNYNLNSNNYNQKLCDQIINNLSSRTNQNPNYHENSNNIGGGKQQYPSSLSTNKKMQDFNTNQYHHHNSSHQNYSENHNSNHSNHSNNLNHSNQNYHNNSHNEQINMTGLWQTQAQMFMGMMKQLLQTQKNITMNQHKIIHQTWSKILPPMLMQQMMNQNMNVNNSMGTMNSMNSQHFYNNRSNQNVFQTQQVPHINFQDPYAKIPSTDAKLYKEYQQKTYNVEDYQRQNMLDSQSYIEKSLQGDANKIPLTQYQLKQYQKQEKIDGFFKKSYKVKKFKTFKFLDESSSQLESLSHSISWKDGKSMLNMSFQKDLKMFKQLQLDRQVKHLRQNLNGNVSKNNPGKNSPKKLVKVHSYQNQYERKEGLNIKNVLRINDFDTKTQSSKNVNNSYLQNSPPQPKKGPKKDQLTPNQHQYSPNSKRNSKSCHQQYEEYLNKDKSSISNNPFLKKHISSNDQQQKHSATSQQQKKINHQKYNKFNSLNPSIESPKKISTQILQQDEYQTQPRKKYQEQSKDNVSIQLPGKSTVENYQRNKKVMNIIVANNQMLQKYDSYNASSGSKYQSMQIPSQKSPSNSSNKESFSNVDISPVRNQNQAHQQSLQTVKSQEQSGRIQHSNMLKKQKKYQEIQNSQQNQQPTYRNENQNNSEFHNELKTVQSCQQSSGILIMNRPRPPMLKKHRSTSRKKQTSLTRSKVNNKTLNESSNFQSNYNQDKYAPSYANESSNQDESKNYESSSLLKPPKMAINNLQQSQQLQNPKFDSHVYDSCYESTLNEKSYKIILPKSNLNLENQVNNKQVQNSGDSSNLKELNINKKQQQKQKPVSKWKSLQQARNMARQYRQKLGQDNRSSVQQKLSELQSILSSKKDRDQSILSIKKQAPSVSQNSIMNHHNTNINNNALSTQKKKFTDKKQILKILDDLSDEEDQNYADDFDSYRDQTASKVTN